MNHKHKRNKGLRFLIGLILFLTVISIGGFAYLSHRNLSLTLEPASLDASNEQLYNPYCGWYQTYDYTISDTSVFDSDAMAKALVKDNATRLCCLRLDISAYRDGSISDYGLAEITAILSAWSSTDKQLILRFDYGPSSEQSLTEPEDISTVYLHMEQLAPVIDQYKHYIYTLQGIFAGSYGNGTDSSLADTLDVTELAQYLASLTDSTIPMAVYGTDQYYSLLNNSNEDLLARFGIYQDDISSSLSADALERFQATSLLRPVGGAIGEDVTLYDTGTALTVLQQLHVSYLNEAENATILDQWKSTTYRDDTVFSGLTLFDYISTHLGYRYVMNAMSLSFDTWQDETATLTLTVQNTGFANCYHTFDTSIFLRNTETEEMLSFPINTDNRDWNPGEDTLLTVDWNVRDYDKGEYTIYFMMMDASTGEVIHIGNTAPLTSYGYEIGTLIIE